MSALVQRVRGFSQGAATFTGEPKNTPNEGNCMNFPARQYCQFAEYNEFQ
jgi:hypothetical protein